MSIHADRRHDDYFWLREHDNPDVVAYLEEENRYAAAVLERTESLQETLYQEMVARIRETDSSVPERRDGFLYYMRTEKDRQYEIFCRRRDAEGASEQIVLDENNVAAGKAYCAVGAREVSPDHSLLAYTVDSAGTESYSIFVVDIETGAVVDGPIVNAAADIEWANDSRTLFYLLLDEQMRPFSVRQHTIGTAAGDDRELYSEPDPGFYVGIDVSRSRRYLFVSAESHTTSEVHALRLAPGAHPSASGPVAEAPRRIRPRRSEIEYHVDHAGQSFFILTNEGAVNFKLVEVSIADPGGEWREIIPHRPSVKIESVDAFERHLVVVERENGLKRVRVIDLITRRSQYLAFDEPVYTVWLEKNPEFDTGMVRFSYSSLTTPRTVIDYDIEADSRAVRKRYDVLDGFDPSNYASERIFATTTDGTRIPMSIVYRKDRRPAGDSPLLLYGYGAYGVCVEPHFVANRISLLDRGVAFAIAHVRGGGDLGRSWYEYGKRLYKRNTFNDFIVCAEHLVAQGYAARGNIICYGGSAGGLLIGAVMNMRPDLWRAAVAVVPFVDVLNTMLDDTLPLTVIEYDEWGSPQDKKYYEYIRSYSPYDNVARQEYPAALVLSGFNDRRVHYWEPAKWVAKLRALKTDSNPLLLRTRMGEGHKGASGRYDYLRDVALEYAFILESKKLVP